MEMQKKRVRNDSIDVCRGICILLVILGHQFQRLELTGPMQVIYSFHMPLMFIISGLFISEHKKLKSIVIDKIKRLIIPYCVCAFIMLLLDIIKNIIKGQGVIESILRDIWITIYGSGACKGSYIQVGSNRFGTQDEIGMLWFLLALFWAYIIVSICLKVKCSWIFIIMVSCIGYFSSYIILLPFSIQNGMACTIWVYCGYMITQYHVLENIRDIKLWLVVVGAICWIISVLYGCTHLYENYYKLGIIELIGAMFASWCVYCISYFAIKRVHYIHCFLMWIGQNTMAVYALHFWENRLCSVLSVLSKIMMNKLFITPFISWIIIVVACAIGILFFNKIHIFKSVFQIRDLNK